MDKITDKFTFKRGFVLNSNRLIFAATQDGASPVGLNYRLHDQKQWFCTITDWEPCAIAAFDAPRECCLLGREGEVSLLAAGGEITEQMATRGPLRELRVVDKTFIAVGMGRQVYQRIGKNNWHKMENGLPEKRKLGVVVGFNAISGSKNNMVAVGWAGEIWHYDGKMWSACASPTNIALFDVQMVKPDLFYACGQVATLLVGDGKNWKIVEAECEKKIGEWHSMAWFQNKLYLTDSYDLYVLEGDEIKQVKIHPKERIPCAHLHTDGNVLLSTSPKDLWMTTDGKKWTQLHNT